MIQVFHIFKKHAQILKADYTPDLRKSFFEWEDQMTSRLGTIQNNKLLLPADQKERINSNRIGTLIIQDIIGYSDKGGRPVLEREVRKLDFPDWYLENWLKQYPEFIAINKEDRIRHFEIFSLETAPSGEIELFLRYNELHIGRPWRKDFKLCSLKIGQAVEILINGKLDFTMTGRRERSYSEFDYIIHYLGDVQTIEFVAENKLEMMREIPWKTTKKIDLRKAFY